MENDTNNTENQSTSLRSFQERKSCYRNLLDKIEVIEEKKDLGLQTAIDVGDILKEINNLEEEYSIEQRVDRTDETLLDCMVLSSTSNILVKCIHAVDLSSTSYDPTELCNKLCEQLKSEDEEFKSYDLLKLISEARTVVPVIFPYVYIYGSYDAGVISTSKKKIPLARSAKEKLTKKEPEKVVEMDNDEKGIDEIVKGFYNALMEEYKNNGEQPINYYDYVIDSSDFSSTVENMFYCSFLIRDGKAKIDLDNKNPTITPMSKKELSNFRNENGVNSQIITVITMEDWESHKTEGILQRYKKINSLNQGN
ncbi:hypothetical protein WA026_010089 [Henosepilachna vigintioctopunctata]|uniref:Non-structural maintenance of chromosomes element 4 n=1 Tax=Henosepilachna vigintioctopunctata TaxID=420089 RepID=A0AAW1UGM2_9CUCU